MPSRGEKWILRGFSGGWEMFKAMGTYLLRGPSWSAISFVTPGRLSMMVSRLKISTLMGSAKPVGG